MPAGSPRAAKTARPRRQPAARPAPGRKRTASSATTSSPAPSTSSTGDAAGDRPPRWSSSVSFSPWATSGRASGSKPKIDGTPEASARRQTAPSERATRGVKICDPRHGLDRHRNRPQAHRTGLAIAQQEAQAKLAGSGELELAAKGDAVGAELAALVRKFDLHHLHQRAADAARRLERVEIHLEMKHFGGVAGEQAGAVDLDPDPQARCSRQGQGQGGEAQ